MFGLSPQSVAHFLELVYIIILQQIFPPAALANDFATIIAAIQPLFLSTPAAYTYANNAVIAAWNILRFAAIILLLLQLVGGGYQLIMARSTGTTHVPPHVLLSRLVTAALGINLTLVWGRFLIEVNNALCSLTTINLVTFFHQVLGHAPTAFQTGIFQVTTSLIFGVALFLIAFQVVERIALINVLLVLAPLAVFAWVSPLTQPYAAFWSRTFTLAVFVQFFQVLTISLGVAFITTLMQQNVVHNPTTLQLISIGLILLVGQMPRLLYRFGLSMGSAGGGGNVIGDLVRMGFAVFLAT